MGSNNVFGPFFILPERPILWYNHISKKEKNESIVRQCGVVIFKVPAL